MIVTLRELLSAKIFTDAEPIVGEAAMDNKVSSLIILDSPNGYKFTEPNMLIISSGYFLSTEDTAGQRDLIKNLAAQRVAGLMIKPTHFKDYQIPQALITQAEISNLPFIILWNNSFSYRDFINFFDTHIYCRDSKSFLKKEDLPTQFSQCINAHSLPGLAKQLHLLSGHNVTALFSQQNVSYPAEHINSLFSQKVTSFASQKAIKPSVSFPGLLEFQSTDAQSEQAVFGLGMEFRYNANETASVWLDCSQQEPDENDAFLLKSAQLACKTETKLIINYQQEQARQRMQFIEQLLSGQLHSTEESAMLSRGLNWRIPLKTQLLVLSWANRADLYQDMEAAVHSFFKAKKAKNEMVIIYPYQKNIAILLPPSYINQKGLLLELQASLENCFPKERFILGLGRAVSLKDTRVSYEQAKFAAHIGELLNSDLKFFEFQQLGFYRLYCMAALPDELFRFYDDYITPLLEMDKSTNLDLLHTLRVYFECQENFSRTGKALFLQPNAVRYRMEVIEKACNIDLKNHFDSLSMKLALYLIPIVSPEGLTQGSQVISDLLIAHSLSQ